MPSELIHSPRNLQITHQQRQLRGAQLNKRPSSEGPKTWHHGLQFPRPVQRAGTTPQISTSLGRFRMKTLRGAELQWGQKDFCLKFARLFHCLALNQNVRGPFRIFLSLARMLNHFSSFWKKKKTVYFELSFLCLDTWTYWKFSHGLIISLDACGD